MGRFIVLLLIVGAIMMFLMVLNTPPQMIRDSYLYQRYVAVSEDPVEEPEDEPPASARPGTRRAIAQTTRSVAVSSAAAAGSGVTEPLSAPRIDYNGMVRSNTPSDVVSMGNDALIYASNSPNAPVLKVLNKGQLVEVDLEVITPGGRWALVTIPEDELSGFVRTDGLVMMPPTAGGAAPAAAAPRGAQ